MPKRNKSVQRRPKLVNPDVSRYIGTAAVSSVTKVFAKRTMYQVANLPFSLSATSSDVNIELTPNLPSCPAWSGVLAAYEGIRVVRVRIYVTGLKAPASATVDLAPEVLTLLSSFRPEVISAVTPVSVRERSDIKITPVATLKSGPILLASFSPVAKLNSGSNTSAVYSDKAWIDTDDAANLDIGVVMVNLTTCGTFTLSATPTATFIFQYDVQLSARR